MINNLVKSLLNLQNETDKRIIFSAVDKNCKGCYRKDGIEYFPDETALRKWKLGKNNVIWLDKVADQNCRICSGRGYTGMFAKQADIELPVIEATIIESLEDNPEAITEKLIELMKLPQNLQKPMDMLIKIAQKDLADDNLEAVAVKYAKMIKHDFILQEMVWCECFVNNLQKEIELVRRNIKFSIN